MSTNVAPTPEQDQAPKQDRTYTRTPMGVITQYEIASNEHLYLVEIWRGNVSRCTCHTRSCQHGRLSLLLEEQWQALNAPEAPESCSSCGRMARMQRGLAYCSNCAS
ncbi:hypothetical protein ccbrp13_56130 [Ktedonobacteria bacterium brp13]|nr:hypothetical protein ccbrp13_56130 [Ktedonobacteria bacterium brp13]